MKSLLRVAAVLAVGLLPAATAFAQDLATGCAVSGNPALERSLGPLGEFTGAHGDLRAKDPIRHRDCGWFGLGCVDWGGIGRTALTITDDISTVAGIGVTTAVLIGFAPAWLPVAAAVVAGYGLVRWGSVLVARGVRGQSLDPIHDENARRAWLSLASNSLGLGTAGALAAGARSVAIGTTIASNVTGAGGTVIGVVQTLERWKHLSNGQRVQQLLHDMAGIPNDPSTPAAKPATAPAH